MENIITIQDTLAFISMIISCLSLLITIIFNLINQYRIIRDNEPQLSFSLNNFDGMLYLLVHNTGKTKATNIKLDIKHINNNNGYKLLLDDLFKNTFELYPNEQVQGKIAIYGEDIRNHVFPYINVDISYKKDHIFRNVNYKRTIFFTSSAETKVNITTNYDFTDIEENIEKLHKSALRLANYFDGCEVSPFADLNLIPGRHFQEELVDALNGKKTAKINRENCIKKRLKKSKMNEK